MNTPAETDDIQKQLASFGARLRELRVQNRLTLQQLSEQSGLSKAFLSRLESGDRQASISAALALCRIFRVNLASLFEEPEAAHSCTIIRASDVPERSAKGLKYSFLSDAGRLFNVQPMRVKVSPSRSGDEHYQHDGEEWIYVLHGKLTLSLVGKTYDLDEGDAAHFESRLPHRLIARGGREAEILVIAAPSFSSPTSPLFKGTKRPGLLAMPEGIPVKKA